MDLRRVDYILQHCPSFFAKMAELEDDAEYDAFDAVGLAGGEDAAAEDGGAGGQQQQQQQQQRPHYEHLVQYCELPEAVDGSSYSASRLCELVESALEEARAQDNSFFVKVLRQFGWNEAERGQWGGSGDGGDRRLEDMGCCCGWDDYRAKST